MFATTSKKREHCKETPSYQNKKRKRRQKTSHRNQNGKQRSRSMRAGRKDIYESNNGGTPSPVIVLTRSQEEGTSKFQCMLSLRSVKKHRNRDCLRVVWSIKDIGQLFSIESHGLLVCKVAELTNLPSSNPFNSHHLKFVGDANPKTNRPNRDEALALIAVWRQAPSPTIRKNIFTEQLIDEIRCCKQHIAKEPGVTHFGISGEPYAYGSHASYSSVSSDPTLSSVRQYATKKVSKKALCALFPTENIASMSDEDRNQRVKKACQQQELTLASELRWACHNIDNLFSNMRGPSVTASGTLLNKTLAHCATEVNPELHDHLRLLPGTSYAAGYISIDSETSKCHTEGDCAYTMISVPSQPSQPLVPRKTPQGCFNLVITGNEKRPDFPIPLNVGMSLFYSGLLVMHNQELKEESSGFVNVSAYGNKALYSRSKCTIRRNKPSSPFL